MQGDLMPVAGHCHEKKTSDGVLDASPQNRVMIFGRYVKFWVWTLVAVGLAAALYWVIGAECFAQASLPGSDASDKLEAAGTLLRLLDTALFKWGARIFAGICIMSAAWSLKEQRFGIAIICIVGALIFGTAPTWVKNIFSIGAGDSIFGN